MKTMQKALVLKDIKAVTTNKRLFSIMLIVPIVMVIILPSIFIYMTAFTPAEDFQQIISMIPQNTGQGSKEQILMQTVMNNVIPMFFLIIPIMSASVTAASSFVGEKEKHTLETLLYCPLPLKEIYRAKILASFLLSMAVSVLSFLVMLIVVETESKLITGVFIIPGINWLILMVLVSPAITAVAITLIVRGSAKAQTAEESQQRSLFLFLPVILLSVSQFTGLLLIDGWMLIGIGIVLAIIAYWLMSESFKGFHYESLLK